MTSNFLGLRTAIYKVSELEKAKDWYTEALGVRPYFDQPFYVGFNVGGYELGLQPDAHTGEKSDSVVTYWGVADAAASYKRLLELGAKSHSKPFDVGEGIIVASVTDPWGNIFGVIFNPHFKAI